MAQIILFHHALGLTDGVRALADQIAAAGVPVLLNPIDNLPSDFEMRAARMENAAALNAAGVLDAPSTELVELLALAGLVHDATGGVFDPSIRGRTDQFVYKFVKPKA